MGPDPGVFFLFHSRSCNRWCFPMLTHMQQNKHTHKLYLKVLNCLLIGASISIHPLSGLLSPFPVLPFSFTIHYFPLCRPPVCVWSEPTVRKLTLKEKGFYREYNVCKDWWKYLCVLFKRDMFWLLHLITFCQNQKAAQATNRAVRC